MTKWKRAGTIYTPVRERSGDAAAWVIGIVVFLIILAAS